MRRGRGRIVPRLQPPALGAADGAVADARRTAAGALERLPELPLRKWNYARQLAGRFRDGALLDDGYERFFAAVSISTPDLRSRIYRPDFFEREAARSSIEHARWPSSRPANGSPVRPRAIHDGRPHGPHAGLDVPAARPREHGAFARSAGAVPVAPLCRFRADRADGPQAQGQHRQICAAQGGRAVASQGRSSTCRKIGFQLPLADWFMGGFNHFAREAWGRARPTSGFSTDKESTGCSTSIAAAPRTTVECSMRSRCSAAGGRPAVQVSQRRHSRESGIRSTSRGVVKAAGPPLSRG